MDGGRERAKERREKASEKGREKMEKIQLRVLPFQKVNDTPLSFQRPMPLGTQKGHLALLLCVGVL